MANKRHKAEEIVSKNLARPDRQPVSLEDYVSLRGSHSRITELHLRKMFEQVL